jgi:hypothetical protein
MAANSEKKTVTGFIQHVYATGGKLTLRDMQGKEHTFEIMDPRYWATGSSARSFRHALALQKKVGRIATVHAEYHSAFGWVVFGRGKITTKPLTVR